MSTTNKNKPEMGKWLLWRYFASDPSIRQFLPPTALLTRQTLQSFLSNYHAVYIKPTGGWGGKGIIKAWRSKDGYTFVLEKGTVRFCATIDRLFQTLKKIRGNRSYIVQKAIDLASINSRPFDIRLMMMRDQSGKWQYAGMLAKIAGSNSIITNIARGKGYVMEVEPALRKSLGLTNQQITQLKKSMIRLGHLTAKRFSEYKYYYNLGLDLAADKKGKLWMIEENTGPALYLFARLKDKTMYRNIMRIVTTRRRKKS